ncbi:MAG: hypothetical protein CL681_00080 [Blastopirellula sp.]|nr:hypothetical protein [Blastopirellula sp.]|tara:strand:+ start:941 stop:1204 length:264 start_codon:yes stop_codon:yes gene_type:complete
MTLDDFILDLSQRMGQKVIELRTRDGELAQSMSDLYQPSPAGFAGKLTIRNGSQFAWELWLEEEDTWNFHSTRLTDDVGAMDRSDRS